MKKRDLSDSTKAKVLKLAAEILSMHGSIAGDRTCQDWSGENEMHPNLILNDSECDDLSFNYELFNSSGEDYEKGYSYFHDEMVISFALSQAISDMAEEYYK